MVPRTTGCFSFSVSHYFGGILLAALLRCERASRVLTDLAAAWVVGHGFVYLQITFKFFFFFLERSLDLYRYESPFDREEG